MGFEGPSSIAGGREKGPGKDLERGGARRDRPGGPRRLKPAGLTMIQGWFMNSVMAIRWVGSVFSRFRMSIFTAGGKQGAHRAQRQLRGYPPLLLLPSFQGEARLTGGMDIDHSRCLALRTITDSSHHRTAPHVPSPGPTGPFTQSRCGLDEDLQPHR